MEKMVKIHSEYITLNQLLKLVDLISFGAEAKSFLKSTKVLVNNHLESRRGKKLYVGDIVEINNVKYLIKEDK